MTTIHALLFLCTLVGGPMGTETCNPKRPVPAIHFHGTDDEYAPFSGGWGKGPSGTNVYFVMPSILAWVKANGCESEPVVTKLSDAAKDGTAVIRKTYGSGRDGAEVVLVVIEGGGHTWPGQQPRFKVLGKSTKNISANDLMWEFLPAAPGEVTGAKHRRATLVHPFIDVAELDVAVLT